MPQDAEAIQIVAGLFCAILYVVVTLFHSKQPKIIDTVVVFIAGAGIVAGGEIMSVAYTGDLTNLPSAWRLYLGIAGVACVGLALYTLHTALFAKPKTRKTPISKD